MSKTVITLRSAKVFRDAGIRYGLYRTMFVGSAILMVFGAIPFEVINSGEFTLQDLGKFKVNDKPERERRNPRTGEMFKSPAKKVVKITPAKVLRDAVNA